MLSKCVVLCFRYHSCGWFAADGRWLLSHQHHSGAGSHCSLHLLHQYLWRLPGNTEDAGHVQKVSLDDESRTNDVWRIFVLQEFNRVFPEVLKYERE